MPYKNERQQSVLLPVHLCFFFLSQSVSCCSFTNVATALLTPRGLEETASSYFVVKAQITETSNACTHPPVPMSSNVSKEYVKRLSFEFNQARLFSHHRFDWHLYPIILIIIYKLQMLYFTSSRPGKKEGQRNSTSLVISLFTEQILHSLILKCTWLLWIH